MLVSEFIYFKETSSIKCWYEKDTNESQRLPENQIFIQYQNRTGKIKISTNLSKNPIKYDAKILRKEKFKNFVGIAQYLTKRFFIFVERVFKVSVTPLGEIFRVDRFEIIEICPKKGEEEESILLRDFFESFERNVYFFVPFRIQEMV